MENETQLDITPDLTPDAPVESNAAYFEANPHINKKNGVTVVLPTRKDFIEFQKVVDELKKTDPSITGGKLFLSCFHHLQSLGYYKL